MGGNFARFLHITTSRYDHDLIGNVSNFLRTTPNATLFAYTFALRHLHNNILTTLCSYRIICFDILSRLDCSGSQFPYHVFEIFPNEWLLHNFFLLVVQAQISHLCQLDGFEMSSACYLSLAMKMFTTEMPEKNGMNGERKRGLAGWRFVCCLRLMLRKYEEEYDWPKKRLGTRYCLDRKEILKETGVFLTSSYLGMVTKRVTLGFGLQILARLCSFTVFSRWASWLSDYGIGLGFDIIHGEYPWSNQSMN